MLKESSLTGVFTVIFLLRRLESCAVAGKTVVIASKKNISLTPRNTLVLE